MMQLLSLFGSFWILYFSLVACQTTPVSEPILCFFKPRGTLSGKVREQKSRQVGQNSGFQLVFPESEREIEHSFALGVTKTDGEEKFWLFDPISDFNITDVKRQSKLVSIYLSKRNDPKTRSLKDSSYVTNSLIFDDGVNDNKTCRSIYFPELSLHITNAHCITTQRECLATTLKGAVQGKCKKILYSSNRYDVTIFAAQLESTAKIELKPRSSDKDLTTIMIQTEAHDIPCQRFHDRGDGTQNVGVVQSETNSLKMASMLQSCEGQIAKGDSGSSVSSANGEFLGIVWGFVAVPNRSQLVAFTPVHYLDRILVTNGIMETLSASALR